MTRKGRAITLSLSEQDKESLQAIATQLGYTWGDNPNISKLVEAISRRKLLIAPNNDWNPDRINALDQARRTLIDIGRLDDALAIAHLLLERSEVNLPLKQTIQTFVEKPSEPWRLKLDAQIKRQQPFQLSYQDAAERIWQFTLHHAQIVTHEDRQYLDCWATETQGNQDLAALQHNWSLRLDRIPAETAIYPVQGKWRSHLDHIEVELHLSGNLAFAYRTKTDADILNEWHPEYPQVRRVVRRVTNSFWFFRELRRYGPDCVIMTPTELRDRFRQDLIHMLDHYNH
jgi:predicted DNA-binding transcriptional regulator YafY